MFKKGFTLAEVLITLGIVGVIAAITLPTLTQSTTTAQIGPKLAKAASAFEQANKALLDAYDVDKLSDTGLLDNDSGYGEALSNHMSISKDEGYATVTGVSHSTFGPPVGNNSYTAKDGIVYIISTTDWVAGDDDTPPHKDKAGVVVIDINGFATPNEYATDVFLFQLMNDGSLQPAGGTFLDSITDKNYPGYTSIHWKDKCPVGAKPSAAMYCAGHIFENDLKVLYN